MIVINKVIIIIIIIIIIVVVVVVVVAWVSVDLQKTVSDSDCLFSNLC